MPPLFGRIDTLAGDSAQRFAGDGGDCLKAGLNRPSRCVVDGIGGLFIADSGNRRVRVIDLITKGISTYAGNGQKEYPGDGSPATGAGLGEPSGLAVSGRGDLYIADRALHAVRKVDAESGVMTTIAGTGAAGATGDGGPAAQAKLSSPADVALLPDGRLAIADAGANRVWAVDLAAGTITTIAGGGKVEAGDEPVQALSAALQSPVSIACDASGSIYICERSANRIRRLTLEGDLVPFAGSGTPGYTGDERDARAATLREPEGVSVDGEGNVLIADTGNHAVRYVERSSGLIHALAGGRRGFKGDGRDASAAALDGPTGCAADADGYIYIADAANNRIRTVVSAATGDDGFGDDDGGRDAARGSRRGTRGAPELQEE